VSESIRVSRLTTELLAKKGQRIYQKKKKGQRKTPTETSKPPPASRSSLARVSVRPAAFRASYGVGPSGRRTPVVLAFSAKLEHVWIVTLASQAKIWPGPNQGVAKVLVVLDMLGW
jgi:hypothetical protein